jgi:predicted nuclease of predicted toxin-antitoxin system
MKFLVDAQLPPELCGWIEARGHMAVHVGTLADQALRDRQIADHAEAERLVVISKDGDFIELRQPDRFALLWLRCGNVSNLALQEWLGGQWEAVERGLEAGERLITLR